LSDSPLSIKIKKRVGREAEGGGKKGSTKPKCANGGGSPREAVGGVTIAVYELMLDEGVTKAYCKERGGQTLPRRLLMQKAGRQVG